MKSHLADRSDPVYMALGGHTQVTGVGLVQRSSHIVKEVMLSVW